MLLKDKISIIIPAYNEENFLGHTLRCLWDRIVHQDSIAEVLVVDSGSEDRTVEIAKQEGAQVLEFRPNIPGRAVALNRGAQEATGDILLFLDADSFVPEGFDESILNVMNNKDMVGGAFEFYLDGPQFGLRVVEWINRTRYKLFGLYYGDQGIFVSKEVFEKSGGYPVRTIMEASDFCRTVRKFGRMKLIPKFIKTSPRRFVDHGIYRVLARDIQIWWLDWIGRPTEQFGASYWEQTNRKRYDDKTIPDIH